MPEHYGRIGHRLFQHFVEPPSVPGEPVFAWPLGRAETGLARYIQCDDSVPGRQLGQKWE
jgi:hypothetical protein